MRKSASKDMPQLFSPEEEAACRPIFHETTWRPPALDSLPSSWASASRICIDVECKDPLLRKLGPGVRRGGYMIGVGVAIEDGPSFYLPYRHAGGDNLDPQQTVAYLRHCARTFKGDVVGANLSYDLDYLWEEGIEFDPEAKYRDIQIADPLINELSDYYSLDAIAERLGLPGKDETLLREAAKEFGIHPKEGMWQLPARFVGAYGSQDVLLPLQILRRQERLIDENDLWDIWNLESAVLPALVRMRRRGVLVDQDKLAQQEEWTLKEEARLLEEIRQISGVQIPVGATMNAAIVAPALRAQGIQLPQNSRGDSIDRLMLAASKDPVAERLLRARQMFKLRSTFAASVRAHMVNGRIHPTFKQIAQEDEDGGMKGVRFGRLSCVDPNLQQQPARQDYAKEWRKVYVPEPGTEWISTDISQQEPRWTTHFAAVTPWEQFIRNEARAQAVRQAAQNAVQAYIENPLLDNHDLMTTIIYGKEAVAAMDKDTFKRYRTQCKAIFLGLCYGEGGAKLCRDLGLPTRWACAVGSGWKREMLYFASQPEAEAAKQEHGGLGFVYEAAGEEGQRILDTFDREVPFVRELAKACQKRVRQKGYIRTGGGRLLHFPQKGDGSYDWTHKALNRLIQGTSADQVKKAIVACDREDIFLQLQIHDELTSSGDKAIAERQAELLRTVMPAKLPFRVDVEVGSSWGDSMS